MKNIFRTIPVALQHAILIRLGLGLAALTAAVCLLIQFGQLMIAAPFLLAAPLLASHAIYICWLSVKDRCMVLKGTVLNVEWTFLRSRPKALMLEVEGKALRVILRGRLKAPAAGAVVLLYIPDTAMLHEWHGTHQLDSCLALPMEPPPSHPR